MENGLLAARRSPVLQRPVELAQVRQRPVRPPGRPAPSAAVGRPSISAGTTPSPSRSSPPSRPNCSTAKPGPPTPPPKRRSIASPTTSPASPPARYARQSSTSPKPPGSPGDRTPSPDRRLRRRPRPRRHHPDQHRTPAVLDHGGHRHTPRDHLHRHPSHRKARTADERTVNKHYDLTNPDGLELLLDELVALLIDDHIPAAAVVTHHPTGTSLRPAINDARRPERQVHRRKARSTQARNGTTASEHPPRHRTIR